MYNTHFTTPQATIKNKLTLITTIIVEQAAPDKIILLSPPGETLRYANPRWNRLNVLVLTATKRSGRIKLQHSIEKHCVKMDVAANVFIHSVDQFNTMLHDTPYLFPEANFEGDFLYDMGSAALAKRPAYDQNSMVKEAVAHLNGWLPMARSFYLSAIFNIDLKEFQVTALLMYQAMACAYTAVYLVFTGYRPDIYNLDKLRRYISSFSVELVNVYPKNIEREHHFFDLLETAYCNFHNNKFAIKHDDCSLLTDGVWKVLEIAENICKSRIEKLKDLKIEKLAG